MLKINIDNLPKLLAVLNEVGELHVPCENKAGKVDFTKWNLEKRPRFDITLTSKSAKDLFFPQVEDLLTFKTEGKNLSLRCQV
ncbi:MAG: 4Fe-4S ferredoxin, partial [Phascolarctobacterium sp.]|nr:4Fe-4S ferredoxin [Phascolarctobacterium sp.]